MASNLPMAIITASDSLGILPMFKLTQNRFRRNSTPDYKADPGQIAAETYADCQNLVHYWSALKTSSSSLKGFTRFSQLEGVAACQKHCKWYPLLGESSGGMVRLIETNAWLRYTPTEWKFSIGTFQFGRCPLVSTGSTDGLARTIRVCTNDGEAVRQQIAFLARLGPSRHRTGPLGPSWFRWTRFLRTKLAPILYFAKIKSRL